MGYVELCYHECFCCKEDWSHKWFDRPPESEDLAGWCYLSKKRAWCPACLKKISLSFHVEAEAESKVRSGEAAA